MVQAKTFLMTKIPKVLEGEEYLTAPVIAKRLNSCSATILKYLNELLHEGKVQREVSKGGFSYWHLCNSETKQAKKKRYQNSINEAQERAYAEELLEEYQRRVEAGQIEPLEEAPKGLFDDDAIDEELSE